MPYFLLHCASPAFPVKQAAGGAARPLLIPLLTFTSAHFVHVDLGKILRLYYIEVNVYNESDHAIQK